MLGEARVENLSVLEEKLSADREYWLEKLAGDPPLTTFPVDFSRSGEEVRREQLPIAVAPAAARRLLEVCGGRDSLLLAALIALVKVLLHKYSGAEDVVVGTTIHRQFSAVAELNELLAVRDRVSPGQTLRELLMAVKQTLAEAYEHQKFPFQRLLDLLQVERQPQRPALFAVLVILESINDPEHASGAVTDVAFRFRHEEGGLAGTLEYDARLFRRETLEIVVRHLQRVLDLLLAQPGASLGELDLLAEADRERLLIDFNQTGATYPRDRTIHQLFEEQVERSPNAEALAMGELSLTYRELNARANRLAWFLLGAGVTPGALVAVLLEHSVDMVVAVLGVLKAGAAYVPLDPEHPRARLGSLLADCGAAVALTTGTLAGRVGECAARWLCLDGEEASIARQSAMNPPAPPGGAESLAYIIYTSGSTGRPKGVRIRHSALVNYIAWAREVYVDGGPATFPLYTSLTFDLTKTSLFTPLVSGGRLVIYPRRQGEYPLLDLMEDGRIEVVKLTPSHLELIKERDNRGSGIRRLIVGGEALSAALAREIAESFQGRVEICNEYGPTEATVGCMLHRFDPAADTRAFVPIGRPAANVRLYVFDAALRPVTENMAGELYIGGDGLAEGYHARPDLTAERFVPDPFGDGARLYRTGDRVRWLPEGVLDFLGRADEQVKVRGHRIELGEIRGALKSHTDIRDSVVLVAEEPQGKVLVGYYVARKELDEPELRSFLSELLLEEAVPAVFVHLRRLPLTLNGKVNVQALPSLAEVRKRARPGFVAPVTAAEKTMAEIWGALLGVANVGLHDNFFQLGGDSIIAIRVVARAVQAGFHLAPAQIFQFQTVAELTAAAGQAPRRLAEQGPVVGPVPLTPIQRDFFATVDVDLHHYNQSLLLEVRREASPAAWRRAVDLLLEHHDALRLRFQPTPEGWRQQNAAPGGEIPFLWLDLSSLPEAVGKAALGEAAVALQASLDLQTGPLLRVAFAALGGGAPGRLLAVLHHLVVDGVSWRILLEDLATAVRDAAAGAPVRLPAKSTSFREWAEKLEEHVRSGACDAELPYWLSLAEASVPPLPVDFPGGGNAAGSARQVVVSLSAEETRLLLQVVPEAYRTQINDVLLAALVGACAGWTGRDRLLLALEGHGREDIVAGLDLSRTVGWFTTVFPVLLELPAEETPERVLKGVKEQLRRLPGRGIGYGLLRHLRETGGPLHALPEPELSFNYLGRFDEILDDASPFRPTADTAGPSRSPRQRRRYLLDVVGLVAGGCLQVSWTYGEEVYWRETVEALAGSFVDHLRRLVEHCSSPGVRGYTPSDFPLAALEQESLDRLLARLFAGVDVEDVYPLSPLQQGLLFHSLDDPGSDVYFRQLSCVLRGKVDVDALRRACREAAERHPVLRTAFAWEGLREPLQIVLRRAELPVEEIDGRALAVEEREARVTELRQADRARGFDLGAPPLMRVSLLRVEEQVYHLVWSFHHLISDGWSFPLLVSEVFARYEACRRGQRLEGETPRPFREYIAWLRRQDLQAAESFWRRELAGFAAATPLAFDREPRGRREVVPSEERHGALSAPATAALQAWARGHQLTLNTLIQGAWAQLLGRYGGERDVVFGSVSSGRSAVLGGIESMLGIFINTLPVRVDAGGGSSIGEWLHALQGRQVAAREYEYSPLSQVQAWSDVPRGQPLFLSLTAFENYPVNDSIRGQGASFRIEAVHFPEATNYPLTLMAAPGPRLSLRLIYDRGCFDPATAERRLQHLLVLLEGMAGDAARPADLPLLSAAERHQLVREWNDTAAVSEAMDDSLLQQLFERQAARRPDGIAAVFEGQQLSYAELNRRSNRLAHHLRRLGIGAGGLVGIYLERSLEMIPALLAVLKAGAGYVPLAADYPPARLERILGSMGVRCLLTQRARLERIEGLQLPALVHRLCLDQEDSVPGPLPETDLPPVAGPDETAYVIFTSGSTGMPKGVVLRHRPVVNLIRWVNATFAVGETDRVLFITSLCFDLSVYDVFGLLAAGGTVRIATRAQVRDPLALLELLRHEPITFWDSAPAALQQLAPFFAPRQEPSALRLLFLSGDWVPVHLPDELRRAFPAARVIALGGATEAAIWSNFFPVGEVGPDWVSIPYGRPIDNARYHVLDARLEPCPVGVAGDLYIAGGCLASGYAGEPGLTAERFQPDRFAGEPGAFLYWTGDRARYLADGNLEFLGRLDHQVKIRGFRIELGEIEAALAQHPDVGDPVVLVREDEPGHRRLVAYFVPRRSPGPVARELRELVSARLPDYMVPVAFVPLAALPVTANGKLDRKALPAPERDTRRGGEEAAAPRTDSEEVLAGIWAELLRVERVGVHDNYFELGGDSILSIQIVSRAARAGLQIRPHQLFQYPTIAELAAVAVRGEAALAETVEAEEEAGPVELTPAFHWFFEQELAEPYHFNQALLLEMRHDTRLEELAGATAWLLRRHDALRLRFQRDETGWSAAVSPDGPVGPGDGQAPFCVVDLSAVPDAEQGRAVERLVGEAQTGFHLAGGTLLRAVLFRLGTGRLDRLLLAVHHLAIDGVSWRILLEDLAGRLAGMDGEPLRTTSFRRWSGLLSAYARAGAAHGELAYWTSPDREMVAALPLDHSLGVNTTASAALVAVSLPAAETQVLLHETAAAYRTQIGDALLAALVQAVAGWTGSPSLLLELEGHGREEIAADVDLSRTLGWFTTFYPVRLDIGGAAGPGEVLKRVKEQLRAVPGRGLGYGLLRHLAPEAEIRERLHGLPQPEISFNYLGQLDQGLPEAAPFAPARESCGATESPRQVRRYALTVTAAVQGGELRVSWLYSENLHRRATIERLAAGFLSALRHLIEHCRSPEAGGATPSDFPLARLAQADVDRIVGQDHGIEDVYPLAPLQQGLLFHALASPAGSDLYFEQLSCRLAGELDLQVFGETWRRVVERHPILRTAIIWDRLAEPLQVVYRGIGPSLEEQDWSGLPAAEQEARLADWRESDRRRGLNLALAPLMRLGLVRLGPRDWVFAWSFHHLLLDGWSLSLLLQEVFACYDALRAGREPELPRPRPYRDYVSWVQAQDMAASEAFWRGTLAGFDEPTPLPFDRPAALAAGERDDFDEVGTLLSPAATEALEALARRCRVTVNTLVQGAWALLLSRYAGEPEIVFGAVSSGRPAELAGVESMVGLFINTLPVRVPAPAGIRLGAWLADLQERNLAIRQHEHSPLVQVQGWSGVGGGRRLFDSIVVFESFPVASALESREAGRETSLAARDFRFEEVTNYPLSLQGLPGERLRLQIGFDAALFDAASVTRLLGSLAALLDGMTAGPDSTLEALPLMTAVERHRLLVEWNPAAVHDAPRAAVQALIEDRIRWAPDTIAVEHEGGALSGAELDERAAMLARRLWALGVGPEVPVAVYLGRSPELVVALLAVWKAGGVYLPLDPFYPRQRLAFMLEDSGAPVVVTLRELAAGLPPAAVRIVCLDEPGEPGPLPPPDVTPEKLAYLIYTSGSTGEPKGVGVPHGVAGAHLQAAAAFWGLGERDRVPLFASPSFDLSIDEIVPALLAGSTLVVGAAELWPPATLLDHVAELGLTVLNPPTAYWQQWVREADGKAAPVPLPLRLVLVGGEAMPVEAARLWWQTPLRAARLLNGYGPTEAIVTATWQEVGPEPAGATGSVPIGRVVGERSAHVLDTDGLLVPIGGVGELCLGGAFLARGYARRPGLTAERFVPDPFAIHPGGRLYRTGDRVRRLADGALEYLGRVDQQVKVRGFRIEIGEIEAVLERHPAVRQAAVAVRGDSAESKRLVAYVIPNGGEPPAIAELRRFARDLLPEFMVPAAWLLLEALPLTPNGKVDRKALPTPEVSREQTGTDYFAPSTQTEGALVRIWQEVLRVERVGVRDNFFDLGGQSMLMLQVYSRIREQIETSLQVFELFEFPTIRSMADRLAREQLGEQQEAGAAGIARAQARREGMGHRLRLGDRRRKVPQERGMEHE